MIEQELREAGIVSEEIETRLDGQGNKTLIITKRELLYFDVKLQRARLREIVNVKTAKTGELSVKSPSENLIEGSIKGFDLAELKFFFEAVKSAIARAKASATGVDLPIPKMAAEPPAPSAWEAPPASSWENTPTAVPSAPAPAWDDKPMPPPNAWMPEKQTFEVGPEVSPPRPSFPEPERSLSRDSWADLDAELNPAKSGSVPPLLNASAMIPAPNPVKAPIDPFAELAKNAPRNVSSDEWGSPSQPINLKPDPVGTAVMVPSSASGEWGGDVMDATTALDSKTPKSAKNTPRFGDNTAALEGIARWLRILSIVFLLVGAILPASILLEAEFNPNLGQLALIIVSFLGGLLLPLIGWGMSELLTSWAKAAGDLRSIRKATLGH